jgi:hypothetical protein
MSQHQIDNEEWETGMGTKWKWDKIRRQWDEEESDKE